MQNQNIGAKKMKKKLNEYIYSKAGTDITVRWKKLYNYTPASEQAKYIKKWADFREICSKTLDDIAPPFKKDVVNIRFKQK